MRQIKIKLSDVRKATSRGEAISDNWQAGMLEILRLPKIAKRWQELNERFQGLAITRHPGRPHIGFDSDENIAIGQRKGWSQFAGYTLQLVQTADGPYNWNSVRDDWYSHSPSCTWDGVRRETICQFAEDLRMLAMGHDHPETQRNLYYCGIEVCDESTVRG